MPNLLANLRFYGNYGPKKEGHGCLETATEIHALLSKNQDCPQDYRMAGQEENIISDLKKIIYQDMNPLSYYEKLRKAADQQLRLLKRRANGDMLKTEDNWKVFLTAIRSLSRC
ncbi:MAG: hypothetical protein ABIQ95_11130 [Bdellovibrionia bacterium]